ncbi:hypothetical protein [Fibrella arboris]|uniref:hypothetical protein n=1 Tax=Fibrella arboris TaxID=3242486 RepID=UPI0035216D70
MKASLLLLLALLTGCVSFNSNIDRAAIPDFTRLLVVSKLPNMRVDYLNMFLNSFPRNYEVCVVAAGPLAFGNPDSLVRKELAACKSQVVLTINPYRNYTTGSGEYIRSTDEVLLEMTDMTTQKSFWKAIAQAPGGVVPSAEQIVRQLRADRIISGEVPYVREMTSGN